MHIVLIDLSIIHRRHWHSTEHEPVSEAFTRTVAEVHRWADTGDRVAVCVDTPPYLRQELAPNYKAQREKAPSQLFGQLADIVQRLRDDGLLVVGARGFEADDIIATFVAKLPEHKITIITGDKDALQLVDKRVTVISPATGVAMDTDAVRKKFGVPPWQMIDLLALTGDKSDNIPGVSGVGDKTAAKWLTEYGSLEAIYANVSKLPDRFGVALVEGAAAVKTATVLIKLRADAPIDVAEIFQERSVKPLTEKQDDAPPPEERPQVIDAKLEPSESMALQKTEPKPLTNGNGNGHQVPHELALEPRNIQQAHWLAGVLYNGRLFGDYPNVEAVLGTILTGRVYGLDAVTSLRSFHQIKGKQTMGATLLVGLVKRRTDICKYFSLVDSTDERATWETHRVGEPQPTRMAYTIAEAKQAGLVGKGGNWVDRPKTMLRHRAATELARAVYPDVIAGLYSVDEAEDIRA